MRNRYFSAERYHQVVVSLSPRGLHAVHMQRGALGWRRAHAAQINLPEGEEGLVHARTELLRCAEAWKLPRGSRAHWILAGDILGIVLTASSDASQTALPFGSADTRTQWDLFGRSENPSLLWIHNDWLAEIEQISGACGWELVEIYSRAQLFQQAVARLPSGLSAVVEKSDSVLFLHLFGPGAGLLRTTTLENHEASDLTRMLSAEFEALASVPPHTGLARRLFADPTVAALALGWEGVEVARLPAVPFFDRMEAFWKSGVEGIVVRHTEGELVRRINALSLALGVAGMAVLGALAWHNAQLQDDIAAAHAQERVEAPKLAAAKTIRSQTLAMTNGMQAVKKLQHNAVALDAFQLILANFPPAPAALLYARADASSLAFAGRSGPESLDWVKNKSFPGYETLDNPPIPPFLQNVEPLIYVEARKMQTHAAAGGAAVQLPPGSGVSGKP